MRRGQARGEQLAPIVRWEPTIGGEILLMDTLAMTLHLNIGDRTVRQYQPIACDRATRAPLWDALDVGARRQQIRPRRRATDASSPTRQRPA